MTRDGHVLQAREEEALGESGKGFLEGCFPLRLRQFAGGRSECGEDRFVATEETQLFALIRLQISAEAAQRPEMEEESSPGAAEEKLLSVREDTFGNETVSEDAAAVGEAQGDRCRAVGEGDEELVKNGLRQRKGPAVRGKDGERGVASGSIGWVINHRRVGRDGRQHGGPILRCKRGGRAELNQLETVSMIHRKPPRSAAAGALLQSRPARLPSLENPLHAGEVETLAVPLPGFQAHGKSTMRVGHLHTKGRQFGQAEKEIGPIRSHRDPSVRRRRKAVAQTCGRSRGKERARAAGHEKNAFYLNLRLDLTGDIHHGQV